MSLGRVRSSSSSLMACIILRSLPGRGQTRLRATSRTELALPRSMRRPAPAGRRACRACCDPQIYTACRLYTPHTHTRCRARTRGEQILHALTSSLPQTRARASALSERQAPDHPFTIISTLPLCYLPGCRFGCVFFCARACCYVFASFLSTYNCARKLHPISRINRFCCCCVYCMRCTLFLRPAQHIEYAVMAHCDRFESATIAHVFRLAYNEAASTC